MNQTHHGWRIFDAATPLLTYEYNFGAGNATAIAVGTGDGLVVISPPCRVSEGVFDDLAQFGPVCALVAPNAYHHMGLVNWRERFPAARLFAPAQAIERVGKQTGLAGLEPVSAAGPLLGERIELVDLPHCKTGETLVCVQSGRGLVWFVADVVTNMPSLPDHPIAKWIFKFSGSAPGLKFNNLAGLIMVRDKPALKRLLAAKLAADVPSWLIPSHGDPVDLQADPLPLRRVFSG